MDEEQLYENSTKIEPIKEKKTEKRNPLYGQLSPRIHSNRDGSVLDVSPHHLLNGDGKQVTRVTNPIYNHPKLTKCNSVHYKSLQSNSAYRIQSAPLTRHSESIVMEQKAKPKRSLSRLKFRKRSKISVRRDES